MPRSDLKDIFEKFEKKETIIVNGKEKNKRKKKPALFVCRKHWPKEMPTYERRGKVCPINPPSRFGKDQSEESDDSQSHRPTKRSLSSIRSVSPHELQSFLQQDNLAFDEIEEKIEGDVITFKLYDDLIAIQSRAYCEGVPLFLIHVSRNLSFKTFHLGSVCTIRI